MASDKQATLKIDADGNVMSCAKGAMTSECGYKAGSPVCGKCGAMAVEVKYGMMPQAQGFECKASGKTVMEACEACPGGCAPMGTKEYGMMPQARGFECKVSGEMVTEACEACPGGCAPMGMKQEEMPEEVLAMFKKKKRKKKMGADAEEKAAVRAYGDVYEDDEEEEEEEEIEDGEEVEYEDEPTLAGMRAPDPEMQEEGGEDEDLVESLAMARPPMRKRGTPMMPARRPMDEEDSEMMPARRPMDEEDSEMMPASKPMDEEDSEMMPAARSMRMPEEDEEEMPDRSMMRNRRLATMGFKDGEFGNTPFVCSIERKVYPGNAKVCENCPGGCVSEGDMPALLEIEGIAEDTFGGKVLDSGYSDSADVFVVDIERKDGKPVEAFFDGTTGECMGWHLLNEEVMQVKSAFEAPQMVSFSDAAEIATKSIAGDVVSIEADLFEGYDAYAVEIEGVDGKSYDVFVSLDGEILGYDTYTQEEASAIESEAAELALKRAHDEVERKEMASSGEAMDDGEMPIRNSADLRNAIMSWPRSANRDAAKLHIMRRAAALGLESSLPADWVAQELEQEKSDANFMSSLLEFEMIEAESQGEDPERMAEIYFKKMFSEERRSELAKRGMALPDGSYPIESEEDLKNAIQAYGRAKDKDKAKAHITKRAKALGKDDLIPDNWR